MLEFRFKGILTVFFPIVIYCIIITIIITYSSEVILEHIRDEFQRRSLNDLKQVGTQRISILLQET